jgi:hypothetical protein
MAAPAKTDHRPASKSELVSLRVFDRKITSDPERAIVDT